MIDGKRILAIIPARSGSKGIPHKNIRPLGDKPLMAYSIEAARGSRYVDEVMVSTDSEEYAAIARSWGASVPFLRPAALAGDKAKTIDAVLHVSDEYEQRGEPFDIALLLQPTSPFRTTEDIDGALEFFLERGSRGLVSISRSEVSPLLIRTYHDGVLQNLLAMDSTVRRQDMEDYYRVNGAIYINATDELAPTTSLNDNPIGFIIEEEHGLDIDEPLDFLVAQVVLEDRLQKSHGEE